MIFFIYNYFKGILKYGIEFKKVTCIVFPHIPGPLLEAAWTELFKIGQISIPWNNNKKNRIKSKTSKSKKIRCPQNDLQQVINSEPITQSKVPFNASQQISSIPIPKKIPFKGRSESQFNSDYENRQDDDITLLVATPLPEPIPLHPVRGAGRGANPTRKKRGRIDKDIIDTSVSIKKVRF